MGTCVHGYIEEYGCHIACFRIENLNRYSLLKKIQNGVDALARKSLARSQIIQVSFVALILDRASDTRRHVFS